MTIRLTNYLLITKYDYDVKMSKVKTVTSKHIWCHCYFSRQVKKSFLKKCLNANCSWGLNNMFYQNKRGVVIFLKSGYFFASKIPGELYHDIKK